MRNKNISKDNGTINLIEAVKNNDIELVKQLINAENIDERDEYGNTALGHAIQKQKFKIVKLLVENGASFKVADKVGWSALHVAVNMGNIKIANFLIDNNIDINIVDNENYTPLHGAVINSDLKMVKFLINKGANTELKASKSLSLLQLSFLNKNNHISNFFIKNGININELTNLNIELLNMAIIGGKIEVIKLFEEKGVDIINLNYGGDKPLHLAVENNKTEVIEYLLEKGAEIDALDSIGRTLLHIAVQKKNSALVKLLLSKGANIVDCDTGGQTALFHAVTEHLINTQALKDNEYSFLKAQFKKNLVEVDEIIKCLIANKANIDAKNKFENTIFDLVARDVNYKDACKLLLSYAPSIKPIIKAMDKNPAFKDMVKLVMTDFIEKQEFKDFSYENSEKHKFLHLYNYLIKKEEEESKEVAEKNLNKVEEKIEPTLSLKEIGEKYDFENLIFNNSLWVTALCKAKEFDAVFPSDVIRNIFSHLDLAIGTDGTPVDWTALKINNNIEVTGNTETSINNDSNN